MLIKSGPSNARILVVGEYPTMEETRKQKAFSSPGGLAFKAYMREAGIDINSCLFVSLAPSQPLRKDMTAFFYTNQEVKDLKLVSDRGLFPKPEMQEAVVELNKLIEETKPEFIIASGSYVLWALTENQFNIGNNSKKKTKVATGILNYRGSHLYYEKAGLRIPLLPVLNHHDAEQIHPYTYRIRHDLRARYSMFKENKWDDFERDFLIRPSYEQAARVMQDLLDKADEALDCNNPLPIAVDIETHAQHIACIGFAWSTVDAICIPFLEADRTDYWTEIEELSIILHINRLLSHPAVQIRGQNFLFDAQYISLYWQLIPYIAEDTMIMQHLLFPGTELDLVTLSSLYCAYHRYWKDDGKEWVKTMDAERLWIYNCRDCVVTFEAAEALENLIVHYKQEEQWKYQQRQLQSLLQMMIRGVAIDPETKHIAKHELEAVIAQYEEELDAMMPESIWPRDPKKSSWFTSTHQMSAIFQTQFGLKPYFNRKKKAYTMDDSALEHYGTTEPILKPLTTKLREYNSLSTFKTFTHMPLSHDGRMRSSYSPTASTFRWKSSKDVFGTGGNLQNLPKGTEE